MGSVRFQLFWGKFHELLGLDILMEFLIIQEAKLGKLIVQEREKIEASTYKYECYLPCLLKGSTAKIDEELR